MKKENKTLKNCSFGKKSLKKAIGVEKNIKNMYLNNQKMCAMELWLNKLSEL